MYSGALQCVRVTVPRGAILDGRHLTAGVLLLKCLLGHAQLRPSANATMAGINVQQNGKVDDRAAAL